MKHILFKTEDKDRPDAICDSNGEVVLGLCKVCNRAESELDQDGGECPGVNPSPVTTEEASDEDYVKELSTNGAVLTSAANRLRKMGGSINNHLASMLVEMIGEHTCFAKAGIDEPLFTLRAQDRLAPKLVHTWAKRAKKRGATRSKVREAHRRAKDMKNFEGRRYPT